MKRRAPKRIIISNMDYIRPKTIVSKRKESIILTPSKASEVLSVKKENSLDLHQNFMSLNPEYDIRKYNKVKTLANHY